jgi:hypothetical protein
LIGRHDTAPAPYYNNGHIVINHQSSIKQYIMCLPKQPKALQQQSVVSTTKFPPAPIPTITTNSSNNGTDSDVKETDSDVVMFSAIDTSTSTAEDDDPSKFITAVTADDVVLGRGAGPNEHAGNIAFRQVVAQFKPSYVATVNRKAKSQIAHKVVHAVKSKRGRFLRRARISSSTSQTTSAAPAAAGGASCDEQEIFVEAEEEVILEKAKQALRYGKRESRQPWQSLSPSPPPTGATVAPMNSLSVLSSPTPSPPQVGRMTLSTTESSSTTAGSASASAAVPTASSTKTPTIAFLLQRQQQTHNDFQTMTSIYPSNQQSIGNFPIPAPRVVVAAASRTESDIIDEALTASVRDSTTEGQMVQLLIDKAVAVRHESPTASAKLLDLVESLLGHHKTTTSTTTTPSIQNSPVKMTMMTLSSQFNLLPRGSGGGNQQQTHHQQQQQHRKIVTPQFSWGDITTALSSSTAAAAAARTGAEKDAAKTLAALGIY